MDVLDLNNSIINYNCIRIAIECKTILNGGDVSYYISKNKRILDIL